jgi:hypothetical protein
MSKALEIYTYVYVYAHAQTQSADDVSNAHVRFERPTVKDTRTACVWPCSLSLSVAEKTERKAYQCQSNSENESMTLLMNVSHSATPNAWKRRSSVMQMSAVFQDIENEVLQRPDKKILIWRCWLPARQGIDVKHFCFCFWPDKAEPYSTR